MSEQPHSYIEPGPSQTPHSSTTALPPHSPEQSAKVSSGQPGPQTYVFFSKFSYNVAVDDLNTA